MSHMYLENRRSLNAFVGCRHTCVYCLPSFQRQMKRQKCPLCKTYEPHSHMERLLKAPPKTKEGEFIFFPSSGDLSWASSRVIEGHIDYAKRYSDRIFLIQSKDPRWFALYEFPNNVILGTTIETNQHHFFTQSKFTNYAQISKAPHPKFRFETMRRLIHPHLEVTIEPILNFVPSVLLDWIKLIKPKIIYVGYDNHECGLPEPFLEKTLDFIGLLRSSGFNVRTKTIRKAWFEK